MTWSMRSAPAWREEAAQQSAVRGVAGRGQARRGATGGRPQSWPRALKASGGRADRHAGGEDVLLRPGVGAAGVHADGQVVDDADAPCPRRARRAAAAAELAVGQPGEPAVEVDPVHQLVPGAGGLGASAGRAGRPASACQSGPCTSARAHQVAWSSRAWPCSARKSQ